MTSQVESTALVPANVRALLQKAMARVRQSSLVRNAGWMFVGQVSSFVLQALYFVLLARLLGSQEYGIYVGAVALVALVSPYSGNGSGVLFLRYVSIRREDGPKYFGNILIAFAATGAIMATGLTLLAPRLINPASAAIVFIVAVADCVCNQLIAAGARVFQAYEQMRITAVLTSLISIVRLIVAGVMLVTLHHATAGQWARAALSISLLSVVLSVGTIIRKFGLPHLSPQLFTKHFGEGFGFSFAASTFSVYNDIDKSMLSHYGMNIANGLYTMAYRVVDMATSPLWAVYAAAQPPLFRAGKDGIRATLPLARKILITSALTGVALAVLMFVTAPILPLLVGKSFAASVGALRWLCILPFFRAFQLSSGGALTGAGFQRYRTIAQLAASAFNFGINLYLIPSYGWLGAAWASLLTDGGVAVLNCAMVAYLYRREMRNGAVTTPLCTLA
jgi:O-antigen/teichoic acid export membrane protein